MQKRSLGSSGLEITTIGLGTWAIGGSGWQYGWGEQDDGESIEAIVRAVELGINWVDTAAVYGDGHSEKLLGRALKKIPGANRPIVATKFGRVIQKDGTIRGALEPESIRSECEASLRRLDIETIDLYQMHWPDPDADIEDAWQTMVALKNEGKVRHIGVSNFSVAQLERLQPIHPVASLQPPYNMIIRGVEQETLAYCARNGVGVVCYSPMCKGLLTGTFSRERAANLEEGDHRGGDPKFSDPQLSLHLDLVRKLEPIASRAGKSLAELSIAWVLRRSEVTSAIVGARRPSQAEGTAGAADWNLSSEDVNEIDELLTEHAAAMETSGATTGRV